MTELTLDQALQKGVEAHKAGKVQEADRYYTAILKANPKHPDANHNMGVLAVGVDKVETALPFFKTALEINPNIAQFWLSYIDALIKLDRIEEAKDLFEKAKSNNVQGDGFDKIEKSLMGSDKGSKDNSTQKSQEPPQDTIQSLINLYTKGQFQQVLQQTSKLLSDYPRSFNLFNIIGRANKRLGKLDGAIAAYQKALSIKPDLAVACNNMGNALHEKGKLDDAITAYNKAISIKPDYAEAYNNAGAALQKQGKLDDATRAYNDAISIRPDYAEAYNNLGAVLQKQGKLEEAITAYKKAFTIKPNYLAAYHNTTECLKIYTSTIKRSHSLFTTDSKIKKLSKSLIMSTSSEDIVNNIAQGLNYINDTNFEFKTPLSQIYRQNYEDLNCKRHLKIFSKSDIIPEFCFRCFKVQVEVKTFIDLVKVTSLFYKYDFKESLTTKTFIEIRPNIPGYYKGLIFCKSLNQAKEAKNLLDINLEKFFAEKPISKIKRGCSEYPLKFPDYGKISERAEDMMRFPKEWKLLERQFDQNELIKPNSNLQPSLSKFCLSDFYILQKWIDYAKGLKDQSVKVFNDRPIVYEDIYQLAKNRTVD